MRKLLCVLLVLLLSGCTALEEEILPTPTATPSASPTASVALSPTPTDAPLSTVSTTLRPSPSSKPAIELIATAKLPGVETGDWYEWDIAGNYPANTTAWDPLYYIEEQDKLISREIYGTLIISRLDGSEMQELDTEVTGSINYYGGWLYYLKTDGVWKCSVDGNEKRLIIERRYSVNGDDYFDDSLYIYDNRIYIVRIDQEYIDTYNLDGSNRRKINIPAAIDVFFEDGQYYSNCVGDGDDGVYRYDLGTGDYQQLSDTGFRPIARNGTVYYYADGMMCNDGSGNRKLFGNSEVWYNDYTIYRNMLLYVVINDYGSGDRDTGMMYAYNLDTEQETALFDLSGMLSYRFYVMENSLFLYSGRSCFDPMYRITFEDNKAYLWRLNNLS
ncbi:MAG: hypothetical protein AAGU32_13190 [Bacillota bacterium]